MPHQNISKAVELEGWVWTLTFCPFWTQQTLVSSQACAHALHKVLPHLFSSWHRVTDKLQQRSNALHRKTFSLCCSDTSLFLNITPWTEAVLFFSSALWVPSVSSNLMSHFWNKLILPGWCEYLCAFCLNDGSKLAFFRWRCVDVFS